MMYTAKVNGRTHEGMTVDGVIAQIQRSITVTTSFHVVRDADKFVIASGWTSPLTN